MKKYIFLLGLFVTGCTASLVRTPAPQAPIPLQEAARAQGVWQPHGLYFSLISHYQAGQARVVIFTEPAIKLIDMTVSAEKIEVHDQAPRVPNTLVDAFAKLVRAHFLTSCPARQVAHESKQPKSTFELEVTGGVCP